MIVMSLMAVVAAVAGIRLWWRSVPQVLILSGSVAIGIGDTIVVEDWSCPVVASISNSNPAIVTCSSSHHLPTKTVGGQNWMYRLEGAADAWAGVNGRFAVQILDSDTFSIPVDTTSFGAFAGQSVRLFRGNHIGQDLVRPFAGNQDSAYRPLPEGLFEVKVGKGYTTTVELLYCRSYPITNFSVANSMATVDLRTPLPNEAPAYVAAPGREIHFRYFADDRLNSNKWRGIQFEDKPHYISEINTARNQIKVPVKVEDGNAYRPAGAAQPFVLMCPLRSFSVLVHPRQEKAFPYPTGRVSNYVKNPPIDGNVNRVYMWVRFGKFIPRHPRGTYMGTVGTYAKVPEDPDDRAERYHFYHYINPNFYDGRWMKIIINETPQHQRSATGTASFPNQPMIHGWPHYSSPPWDGRQGNYFSNMTMFYLDTVFHAADWSDQVVQMGPITMGRVEDEPDAYVSSITAVWAPERAGDRGPGYELGLNAPKYSTDLYEVRYSTEGSLKALGFSNGLAGGPNLRGLNDAVTNLMWYSPSMQEQPNIYVGIRPHMAILGASGGEGPLVLTLRAQPLLKDGDLVNVIRPQGNAEGVPVTVRPAVFWRLGAGLEEIAVVDKMATVRLSQAHDLVPGQVIEISGSANGRLGRFPNQRLYTVTSVPSSNSFTIQTPDVEDGLVNTNASQVEILSVRVFPSLSVPVEGSGNVSCPGRALCPAAGTVVAADDFKNFTEIHLAPFGSSGVTADGKQQRKATGKAVASNGRRK